MVLLSEWQAYLEAFICILIQSLGVMVVRERAELRVGHSVCILHGRVQPSDTQCIWVYFVLNSHHHH